MKKSTLFIIIIWLLVPAFCWSGEVTLKEYCDSLLGLKKNELVRLQKGEKGVEGYALFGNMAPAFLLTGDIWTDQLVSTQSRIAVINEEISFLETLLVKIKQSYISGINSGNIFYPIADNHVYAYDYSGWNKANWGKYEIIGAGWNPTGGEKRAYLKFDVSGIDASTFEKATLKLFHYHTGGGNAAELGVYTVRTPWNEGNGNYKPSNVASSGELCWINQPTSDRYPVRYFNPGMNINDYEEVDITPLVKSWLEGMANNGMVIKAGENYINGAASVYGFYSREHADVDKRPQLIINGGNSNSNTIKTSTNLLDNGSFEDPVIGAYQSFKEGQDIAGWNVMKASVDLTGSYFQSSEGKQSMDLHGTGGFGGIQKSFATVPQQKYNVVFDFAGNAAGGPTVKEMRVSAAGQSQDFKFDCTGKSVRNMGWTTQSWEFTANQKITTLVFETLSSSGMDRYGPTIDNVKVYNSGTQNSSVEGNLNPLGIAGEWELTCTGEASVFIFNFKINQSGNNFSGEMICTNISNPDTKVEGQVFPYGSLKFTRSTGNWHQYYLGKITQNDGIQATTLEGFFGYKGQEKYKWNAKLLSTSN